MTDTKTNKSTAQVKKITIDPVTRVEGHGKVTIYLNEKGTVDKAYFHIVEFRGFERFIQGHPYWEVPQLVQRLCGICPVSHHLAAAKAIDQLVGIDPSQLSNPATKLRKLLHYGQIFQSHALHFFYLASPDLLFGKDAPPEKRNVIQVALQNNEIARKGILMRKFGQEIIKAIAGKKIHGVAATPGGMHKTLEKREVNYFLENNDTPDIETMIQWSVEMVQFIKSYHAKHAVWMDKFAHYPSGHLGMVGRSGELEMYDGHLRAIDANGKITLPDISTDTYLEYFQEDVEKWSYMKFPYLKHLGRSKGWNRVGPLARLNVANYINTPLANTEFQFFKAYTAGRPNNNTMHSHWARLIEMLHCAEVIKELLYDPEILDSDLAREGQGRREGIGVIEAPRGTLIHHYRINENGKIIKCNLIVSTTHNNEAMNQAVKWVANRVISRKKKITEKMLNEVEIAIRAYDPCLSCATHAIGDMPLEITLIDFNKNVIDVKKSHI